MYSSDEYLPTGRLRLGWKYSTSQGAHDKQRVYWENPSRHSVANVEAFETEEERILDDTDEGKQRRSTSSTKFREFS